MKKVIDLLRKSNHRELAELFRKTDWFLVYLTQMTTDEAEKFIQDMCGLENTLEKSEYIMFTHKAIGQKELIYEIRALYLEEPIDIEEACTPKILGLPHKAILASYVSDTICCSEKKLEYLLIEVLHAMYCDIFDKDIMEKLGFEETDSEEDNKQDIPEENLESVLTEEEKGLLLEFIKYAIDFEYTCMQRELKGLITEIERHKAEQRVNA